MSPDDIRNVADVQKIQKLQILLRSLADVVAAQKNMIDNLDYFGYDPYYKDIRVEAVAKSESALAKLEAIKP